PRHTGLPPMGSRSVRIHRICWLARRNRRWCHPAGTNSMPKPSSVTLTAKPCTPAETATSNTPGSKTPTPARPAQSTTGPIAQLTRCQYAVLTHPQRSTVLVIDIDTPSGKTGGTIEALHPEALTKLNTLCAQGFGPAWI